MPYGVAGPSPPPAKRDNTALVLVIIIVIVAAVLLMPIVLYVMVLDFGGEPTTPVVLIISNTPTDGGRKIVFGPPTSDLEWGDVQFLLSDGYNSIEWNEWESDDLTGPPFVAWSSGFEKMLGDIPVWLEIVDLGGNGFVNNGDYIEITTSGDSFPTTNTYTLTVIHEPTSDQMGAATF
jgi:hypothetical protein